MSALYTGTATPSTIPGLPGLKRRATFMPDPTPAAMPPRPATPTPSDDREDVPAAQPRHEASTARTDEASDIVRAIKAIAQTVSPDELQAIRARLDRIEQHEPRTIRIQIGDKPAGPTIQNARPELEQLVKLAGATAPGRRNFWLYGPPGTGKSVLVHSLAQALGLDYTEIQVNIATTPAALLGSIDANGTWHETEFIRLWESGGVILLDELTTNQDLAGALNNALANGTLSLGRHHDPARRAIRRHQDAYVIVADNTTGRGNTNGTLTRCRLDTANLDRFAGRMMHIGYWRELEQQLGQDMAPHLWALRDTLGHAWPVTTRLFCTAADLLAAGWEQKDIAKQLLSGAEPAVLDKAKTHAWWGAAL